MLKLRHFRHAALAALAAITFIAAARGQAVTGFSDLNFWGSGPNRSALVINWSDGKSNQTIAWGYSWSGATTVADMLFALVNADPRLFARIDSATQFGPGIFGIGYDTNGNGSFSVIGAQDTLGNPTTPVFTSGISNMNTNPNTTQAPLSSTTAAPGDAADHYLEGWFDNGFWELLNGTVAPTYPVTWTSSFDGASGTMLVNDGWFALSITDPDFNSHIPGPAMAAPVPEPGVIVLLAIGAIAVLAHVKTRVHAA
ncbi:MAG: hypothetical protein ACREKL_07775 [Chthoniobacterales bacterium]